MYLILQPGKVASQTIEWSIRSSDPTAKVERHHFLSPEILTELDRLHALEAGNRDGLSSSNVGTVQKQLDAARQVRDEVLKTNGPIFVITGFRDPLDLAISAFFQNVTRFCPQLTFDPQGIDVNIAQVMETFSLEFNLFLQRLNGGAPPKTLRELILDLKFQDFAAWLDRELLGVLGIDVFQRQVGTAPFIRFDEGRFTVVLYRFEALGDHLPEVLRQLPGITEPVVKNMNIGSTKDYGPLYTLFKQRFTPSDAMSRHYYGGRYFKHFYSGHQPLYPGSSTPRLAAVGT